MSASSRKSAAFCRVTLAPFLLAFGEPPLAPQAAVAAQKSRAPAARPADKPAERYQVDVRLQVAPELSKSRVIQWIETLRALGVAGVSETAGSPADQSQQGEQTEPAVQSAGPGRIRVLAALGPAGNLRIGSEIFRASDRARLEALVKRLRQEGVPDPDPASPLWGLGQAQ